MTRRIDPLKSLDDGLSVIQKIIYAYKRKMSINRLGGEKNNSNDVLNLFSPQEIDVLVTCIDTLARHKDLIIIPTPELDALELSTAQLINSFASVAPLPASTALTTAPEPKDEQIPLDGYDLPPRV